MASQRVFVFRTWGGARKGAGRKPAGKKAGVAHSVRPAVVSRVPLHVTLRIARGVPDLRAEVPMRAIRRALTEGKERLGLRVVHYAVQPSGSL